MFARFADTLVGHGQAILRPTVSTHLDFEGELALVIGGGGRYIPASEALSHVAGYTCFNDGSIRNFQKFSVTSGKNFPRTDALGPFRHRRPRSLGAHARDPPERRGGPARLDFDAHPRRGRDHRLRVALRLVRIDGALARRRAALAARLCELRGEPMTRAAILVDRFHPTIQQIVAESMPADWELAAPGPDGDPASAMASAGVAFVMSARVDAALLAKAPALRLIHRLGVGYEKIDLDECKRRGLRLRGSPAATPSPWPSTRWR
jgi:hypothetical protein